MTDPAGSDRIQQDVPHGTLRHRSPTSLREDAVERDVRTTTTCPPARQRRRLLDRADPDGSA